jgi:hypothetical protein
MVTRIAHKECPDGRLKTGAMSFYLFNMLFHPLHERFVRWELGESISRALFPVVCCFSAESSRHHPAAVPRMAVRSVIILDSDFEGRRSRGVELQCELPLSAEVRRVCGEFILEEVSGVVQVVKF